MVCSELAGAEVTRQISLPKYSNKGISVTETPSDTMRTGKRLSSQEHLSIKRRRVRKSPYLERKSHLWNVGAPVAILPILSNDLKICGKVNNCVKRRDGISSRYLSLHFSPHMDSVKYNSAFGAHTPTVPDLQVMTEFVRPTLRVAMTNGCILSWDFHNCNPKTVLVIKKYSRPMRVAVNELNKSSNLSSPRSTKTVLQVPDTPSCKTTIFMCATTVICTLAD